MIIIKAIITFMKKHKLIWIIAGLVIGIGIFTYLSIDRLGDRFYAQQEEPAEVEEDELEANEVEEETETPMGLDQYKDQPGANAGLYRETVKVKGIYVSGWIAGMQSRFNPLIQLVNETELNAMVIDVKEDAGRVSYKSSVPWVHEVGAHVRMIGDMEALMNTLEENNIYPIARIVCFKDPILGGKKPELALKKADGSLWRDNKGKTWLNPYNKDTWDYLLELSIEAAKLGFKEIQYDYVRFPTDGPTRLIDYGEAIEHKSKSQIIAEFLSYAKEYLEPMGVHVTADTFGIASVSTFDARNIGHELEWVGQDIDYVCPMIYPSHYANVAQNGVGQRINGVLFERPDLDPYGVVYHSLVTTREKIEESGGKADVRPWLQAFTAAYLGRGNYQVYGGEQIRAQIKATYDAGYEEWLLWNADNRYSSAGLLKE